MHLSLLKGEQNRFTTDLKQCDTVSVSDTALLKKDSGQMRFTRYSQSVVKLFN